MSRRGTWGKASIWGGKILAKAHPIWMGFLSYVIYVLMQSVFSVAARRGAETHWERMDADGRAGALKTDWTEPPQDAGAMGIEWLAEP
jgi:peptidoglycan/LPS O-acetylase OafA/YrhL